MLFDLPLAQLQTYLPERDEPADFDPFWAETLAEASSFDLNPHFNPVDAGLPLVEIFDLTFNGYGGQPINGWLIIPRLRTSVLPCVVEYIGYGGGRGLPHEWLLWSAAGYAHLIMDTRGQGSSWRSGDTPDVEPDGGNPHYPGFMTRGILHPRTYYYRRVFTDAARAIEAARSPCRRSRPHCGHRGQPGRRHRPGCWRIGPGPHGSDGGCAILVPLPACH